MRQRRAALLSLLLLVGLIAIPVVMTWREVKQEQLNHALIAAVDRNDVAAVRRGLRAGADPNAQILPEDKRPVWKRLFARLQNQHIQREGFDKTVLAEAIEGATNDHLDADHAATVAALTGAGANINVRFTHVIKGRGHKRVRTTPLIEAAVYRQWRTVRVLFTCHPDVNATYDWKGATALMYAAADDQLETVVALVLQGARINTKDIRARHLCFGHYVNT